MEILSMNVVVSAIVDPWVTTLSFVVALAMRIQGLKTSKNLWICLISSKNLCSKHRFFALFRRTLKCARDCPSMEPDFLAESELFAGKVHRVWAICRFFSPSLSCFTQTWCTFQAGQTWWTVHLHQASSYKREVLLHAASTSLWRKISRKLRLDQSQKSL